MAIDDQDIIAAWNASQSPGEAAASLGLPRLPFLERALWLRIKGCGLKPMDLVEPEDRRRLDAHAATRLPPWRKPSTAPAAKRLWRETRGRRRL